MTGRRSDFRFRWRSGVWIASESVAAGVEIRRVIESQGVDFQKVAIILEDLLEAVFMDCQLTELRNDP